MVAFAPLLCRLLFVCVLLTISRLWERPRVLVKNPIGRFTPRKGRSSRLVPGTYTAGSPRHPSYLFEWLVVNSQIKFLDCRVALFIPVGSPVCWIQNTKLSTALSKSLCTIQNHKSMKKQLAKKHYPTTKSHSKF